MAGQGQIGLHGLQALGQEIRERVLGAIDHPPGQGAARLAKGQHHRLGAERTHLGHQHARGLHAQPQALEVGRRAQRPVRAHLLETAVHEAESDHLLVREPLEQAAPDRALRHAPHLGQIIEQEGQVEDLELGQAGLAELGQRRRQQLDRTELERLELVLVAVELRVGIDLDPNAARAALCHQALEMQRHLALGRAGCNHMREAQQQLGPGRLRRSSHPHCSQPGQPAGQQQAPAQGSGAVGADSVRHVRYAKRIPPP